MAALAEVTEETWQEHYGRLSPLLSDGRMSKAQAYGQMLRVLGRPPRAGLVREMVRADQELLLANTRLFDDALPFLDSLRARGRIHGGPVAARSRGHVPRLTRQGTQGARRESQFVRYKRNSAAPGAA